VDGNGNVYMAGHSTVTWGTPVQPFAGGTNDAFVAKLNSSGVLQWNTFLGGSGQDEGFGIAVDTSGNIYVVGMSNATWGTPINPLPGGWDAFVAKLGISKSKTDFNGDGQDDILWRYYGAGGYNYVWYMGQSGSGTTGLHAIDSRVINMYQAAALGQVYWDAREAGGLLNRTVDKVYRDAREAGVGLTGKEASAIPEGWFNKLGQAKGMRILKNPMENMVSLLGLTSLGEAALPSVLDPNWAIAGTGDFNGDGKVDILWRYYGAGGYNYVWYMNRVTYTGEAALTSVPDLGWRIANR
jgi:hypothetical protein